MKKEGKGGSRVSSNPVANGGQKTAGILPAQKFNSDKFVGFHEPGELTSHKQPDPFVQLSEYFRESAPELVGCTY